MSAPFPQHTQEIANRASRALLEELSRLLEPFSAKVAPLIVAEPDPEMRRCILDNEMARIRSELWEAKDLIVDELLTKENYE